MPPNLPRGMAFQIYQAWLQGPHALSRLFDEVKEFSIGFASEGTLTEERNYCCKRGWSGLSALEAEPLSLLRSS
jgi:hypothetical protein